MQSEIDLKELVGILRRQRRLVLMTFVVLFLPVTAYLMLATPMYRATALISIEAGGSNVLDPSSLQNSQSAILNSRVDGEVEVLRADATLLAVVERAELIGDPEFGPRLGLTDKLALALGMEAAGNRLRQLLGMQPKSSPDSDLLVNDTIARLRDAVDVRRRGLTYLISVGVLSESPQRAATIANSYVQTYIDRQVRAKSVSVIAARDVLRSQTETARAELARLEDELNSFIDSNLARLEAESDSDTISALRRQLESAKSTKESSISTLAAAQDAATRADWSTAAATLGDTALAQLARERDALARQLGGKTAGSQAQIDLQRALAELEQDLTGRLQQVQGEVASELEAITRSETLARENLRAALLQSDMSSAVIADLFNLQQSASIARTQYQHLLSRVQDLNALANVQMADARVVSEALPPVSVAAPNKRLILVLAMGAGLGLGILVALLNEYYIGGVTSTAQLANIIQAPVQVGVPAVTAGGTEQAVADAVTSAPLSQYAESFRKLRLAIDISLSQTAMPPPAPDAPPRGKVILICSALPGEGKTTTALALARTYAVSGQRTLLIDCDLRKPSVGTYIRAKPQQAELIDYLVSTDADTDLVVRPIVDDLSGLLVITAGNRSAKPTDQLVNSPRFAALIDTVRDASDVIILDSPPLLPVVDTRYLARFADIAVMVVRFSSTTQGDIREASSQMQEVLRPGVRHLGVLNRQSQRDGRHSTYSTGYGAYYGDVT